MTQHVTDQRIAELGRPFLTVWLGQTVSAVGSMLSGVGVGIYVFVETGDARWLGVLAAAAAVPFVLTAPLLSVTDRYPKRTVMIIADVFAVVAPALALVLAVTDRLEIWHLVVAGLLAGAGSSFQFPAAQAAVPALVEPSALERANGLMQLGQALGIVAGPLLAAPIVAWWGIEAILTIDLITFLVAAAATIAVPFDDPATDPAVTDDRDWSSFLAWLRTDGRPFIVLLAVMAVVNFLLAWFNVAVVVAATEIAGVARAGIVLGAAGVAMIVGSLVVARRGVGPDRVGAFSTGMVIAGAGFVLASSRPSMVVLTVGVVIALASVPKVNAAVSTLYHEGVPASMHGRMFGVRTSVGRALEPIGALTAGFVIASLAEPAMADDGTLAGSIGRVVGTGPGRGAALVIAVAGGCLVVAGVALGASRLRRAFGPVVSEPHPVDA